MSITMQDVNALPTVQDDPRVQTLNENLQKLADQHADLEEVQLPDARANAADAAEVAEDLEVEVYASEDVTEKDVEKAQAAATTAAARVEELETKRDKISTAIDRVKDRLRQERKVDAPKRLYPTYVPVVAEAAEQLMDVTPAFLDALEVYNAVRRKTPRKVDPSLPNLPGQFGEPPKRNPTVQMHLADMMRTLEDAVDRLSVEA